MLWYFIGSLLTLPLLYAIMATLVEFRFGRMRCFIVITLAICATVIMDFWQYMHGVSIVDLHSQAWITTCIPSFLSLLYLARYRDGSFLFVYLTECVLASITTTLSYILAYFLPWKSDIYPVVFHTLLLIGILFTCRKLFLRRYFEAAREQGKRWILYCVPPFLCIILWIMYNGSQARFMDIGNKIDLPYTGYLYRQDIPAFIVLLLFAFYLVYMILITITMTHNADTERREKTILNLQSRALKEQLSNLEEKDESMRILRHDLRHHLSTLSALLHSKELIRAQEYVSQLDSSLIQTKQESFSTNAVINAVISFYAGKAQSQGIRFSVQVRISDKLPVDDMDIGAVLSNILENAQNACMKQPVNIERFIEVKFIQQKRQFVLDISNSFDGTVEFDDSGIPVSQGQDHGIGSQSIFAFARKYDSIVDYSTESGVFTIRIMFTKAECNIM